MRIISFFLHRPVLVVTLSLMIVIAGLVALWHLPIQLFPKIENPVVEIETSYAGASAELIQSFVTKILQEPLSGLDGVDYITSTSRYGISDIQVHFKYGVNSDVALTSVMNKLSEVRKDLPQEVNDPVIHKISSDNNPIMIVAFTSTLMTNLAVSDYLQRVIRPKLETINGVSSADVMGQKYAMRIWLDANQLIAHGLTPVDVAENIKKQNIVMPIGAVDGVNTRLNLLTNMEAETAEQFSQITVKQSGDQVVKLGDVARAELGAASGKVNAYVNGDPATMVFIKISPGANPLSIARQITQLMPEIKKTLPEGMQAKIIFDASQYIHLSLKELFSSILITIMIIFAVIVIFIRSIKASLIPLAAIPLSLLGACFLLWLIGGSINTLTLLAMVLAIGLVVDDAIIVLDNVRRHCEMGCSLQQSARQGTQEVATAIIGMSITLVVVYLPIGLLGGLSEKLFAEFSLTLSMSVVISGVLAFYLSPTLCKYFLSNSVSSHQIKLNTQYKCFLEYIFKNKKAIFGIWLLGVILCLFVYHFIPKELAPREDQGYLQVIGAAPHGTNENFLAHYSQLLNPSYHSIPEINQYIYINNIPEEHQYLSFVTLAPWNKRAENAAKLHWKLQNKVNQIPGINSTVIEPPALPADGGLPVEFVLKSTLDYRQLLVIAYALQERALASGLFAYLEPDTHYDQPQLKINVDRKIMSYLGISMQDVVNNVALLYGENVLQKFNYHGQIYPVILHLDDEDENVNQVNIRDSAGDLVRLLSIAKLTQEIGPSEFNQFQKMNSVTLNGVVNQGHVVNDGLNFLKAQAEALNPHLVWIDYAGESRELMLENSNTLLLFTLVICAVFFILAIQFENFISPLIILLGSVPFAIFPALIAMLLLHVTLNIYTKIGLITLVGLICKHGILLVQFANRLMEDDDMSAHEAAIKAADLRVRPILMTSIAMILAAIPLIFASGPGRNARFDLGVVISTGIFFGTLFTLVFVPVLYVIFHRRRACI